MDRLVLYHSPIACSQVSVCALEEAGFDYELRLIDIPGGEQRSPEYTAVTRLGKVPALVAGDEVITENAAILTFIDAVGGGGRLFPVANDPLTLAQRQSGLSFCGATLHPIVRGIFGPQRFTDGDVAPVRSRAIALAKDAFAYADAKLDGNGGWWLGTWSIIDVYLHWAVATAGRGGYDVTAYPRLSSLRQRLETRTPFLRMQQIEVKSEQELADRRSNYRFRKDG